LTIENDADIAISMLRQMAAAVPIANGKAELYEPILYNFKSVFTPEQLRQFEINRHGTIIFTYNGKSYYGYAMSVPAVANVEAEFTLLKLSNYAKSLLT